MNLKTLRRLKRSAHQAAESFRGVDMETYHHLMDASHSIYIAICKAEKHLERQQKQPVDIKKLLDGQGI